MVINPAPVRSPYTECRQPRWLSGLMRSRVHSLWLLVDHCVLRNWDRILVRAVKGLISRAGMVLICPLLWQRDAKLQQTNKQTYTECAPACTLSLRITRNHTGLFRDRYDPRYSIGCWALYPGDIWGYYTGTTTYGGGMYVHVHGLSLIDIVYVYTLQLLH